MTKPAAVVVLCLFSLTAFAQSGERAGKRVLISRAADDVERDDREECADIDARETDYLIRRGEINDVERMRHLVRDEYERARHEPRIAPNSIGGTVWVNVGPNNIAGRARSVAAHPTTAGTVYVGSAGGGVWKTTDSGATWSALTEAVADLAISSVAVAPSSPNTIYVGTGEGSVPGIGLLKSIDGGTNWTLPETVAVSTLYYRLSVNPTNANDVVLTTNNGGFRSSNGGVDWTPWTVPMGTASLMRDVVRDTTNANTLYASSYGSTSIVLKSTDGGSVWTSFNSGLPAITNMIALAIDSAGTTLYAAFDLAGVANVYKSVSGGSWAVTGAVTPSYLFNGQANYDDTIVVSPSSSSTVVVCGVYCSKTTTGGTSWSFLGGNYHVDVHDLRYDAGGTLYIATDGGIYTSANSGDTNTDRQSGMITSQFYKIAIDRANTNRVIGGKQDNGTNRRNAASSAWDFLTGSDGEGCVLNADHPTVAWTSNQSYNRGNHLWKTKDAGGVVTPILFTLINPTFPSTESLPFSTLLVGDPQVASTIYTNTNRLWKSTSGGEAWFPLPTTTTDGSTWSTTSLVRVITIAPGSSNVLMVAKNTDIFRSDDGGLTWVRRITGLPGYFINDIAIDPSDANIAYAALATTSGSSLYYTANGGSSWSLRATGLPLFSAHVVHVDPTDSTTVYCGTDVGVYRSTNQGSNWSLFGTGMPKTAVYDLAIANEGTLLRAGTHGRGVWELTIPAGTNGVPVASISSPLAQTVVKGTTLVFNGTISDPDADKLTGTWTFPDTWERATTTASGATSVSHTFTAAGTWPVALSARDVKGAVSSSTVMITVTEAGETCASPVVIPASGPFPLTMTLNTETYGTSSDGTDPIPSCYSFGAPFYTAWFSFTPTASATYEFSTCGSQFDTVLTAFTGSCGALSESACNDDIDYYGSSGCPNGGSTITVALTAGQTLRIMAGSHYYYTSRGVLALTVKASGSTAPTVTRIASFAGSSTGGTPVTIYGTNFASGMTMTVGGVAATSVAMKTANVATATTPAHAAGAVDVVVTNLDTFSGRLSSGFTYLTCAISLSPGSTSMASGSGGDSFAVTASAACPWDAVSNASWILTNSSGIGNGTASFTVTANTSVASRSGTITVGNQTFTITQDGALPTTFVATATSTTSISLTWVASSVNHFEVWRNSGSGYSLIASPTITSYTDSGSANTTYVYKVRAVDSTAAMSAFTAPDAATTILFTDDPIITSTTIIKAVHVTQLRTAVNAMRTAAAIGTTTFTDASPTGVNVKLQHITELRTALDAARSALLLPALTYTTISTGTSVKGSVVTELQNGVK